MTLDIGRGNDLPVLWYNDVASASLPTRPALRRPPEIWHDPIGCYVELAVRLAGGPRRRAVARRGTVCSTECRGDARMGRPVPGIMFALAHLGHPRAFVRPLITTAS